MMIYKFISKMDKALFFKRAKAHCDIPCGIYDPITAQIAALTVVRMIDLINDLESKNLNHDAAYQNSLSRYINVKEEHAEKVKHEIRVIWGDYIKPPHIEKHPEINQLVQNIFQLGSKCRQTIDRELALQLVESINQFAEIFWETKGISTKRAKAPYLPSLDLVYPVL
jgi:nickel superoxide dismutase